MEIHYGPGLVCWVKRKRSSMVLDQHVAFLRPIGGVRHLSVGHISEHLSGMLFDRLNPYIFGKVVLLKT